jgi:hypothetical protein
MPTYNMLHKPSGRVQVEFMTISEMERWLKRNPEWDVLPAAPMIHSGAGLRKPEAGFRDILKRIKSKHIRSNINTEGN